MFPSQTAGVGKALSRVLTLVDANRGMFITAFEKRVSLNFVHHVYFFLHLPRVCVCVCAYPLFGTCTGRIVAAARTNPQNTVACSSQVLYWFRWVSPTPWSVAGPSDSDRIDYERECTSPMKELLNGGFHCGQCPNPISPAGRPVPVWEN